jgi:hypothetical protein
MLSKLTKHFTFANIALTAMLVFAMTGGAYAASKYLITSTKQISPKVLKQLQGKRGATGVAGVQGPTGAQGSVGPAGAKGETGAAGSNGTSVQATTFVGAKGTCTVGGVEVKSVSPTVNICDGKEGKEGKGGSPWTANGTLPVGSSETGQWSMIAKVPPGGGGTADAAASISFTIPLAKALDETHVHLIGLEEGEGEPQAKLPAGCTGNYTKPGAASGNLCVFTQDYMNALTFAPVPPVERGNAPYIFDAEAAQLEVGAGVSGAYLVTKAIARNESQAEVVIIGSGDWVVTG